MWQPEEIRLDNSRECQEYKVFQSPALNTDIATRDESTQEHLGDISLQQAVLAPRILPQNESIGKLNFFGSGIDDSFYNVGYKVKVQDYDSVTVVPHYEAPEQDIDNNPNKWSVIDSTLVRKTVSGVPVTPYRAPDLN